LLFFGNISYTDDFCRCFVGVVDTLPIFVKINALKGFKIVFNLIFKINLMKIKWGALVVDGRGKIGGHVASKNRSGAYLRTKVTPVNPQTSFQTAVRVLFGAISQAWSGLTDAQRVGWDAAVSIWQKTDIFGDLKSLTGKALFQRLNNQAQSSGYPAVTNVPNLGVTPEGIVTDSTLDIGGTSLLATGRYNLADGRIMVFATAPLSQGTTFVKNKLRLIHTSLGNDIGFNGDAYAAYLVKFGLPVAGDNVYFAFKYVLPTGQASPMQIIKTAVIA